MGIPLIILVFPYFHEAIIKFALQFIGLCLSTISAIKFTPMVLEKRKYIVFKPKENQKPLL